MTTAWIRSLRLIIDMTVTIVVFVLDSYVTTVVYSRTMFIRRLGIQLEAAPLQCASGQSCPDILELADGDFAIIGKDITEFARQLPVGSGCGSDERLVRIPRALLVRARADIPVAV